MNIQEYVNMNLDNQEYSTPINNLKNIDLNEQIMSEMMNNVDTELNNLNLKMKNYNDEEMEVIQSELKNQKDQINNIQNDMLKIKSTIQHSNVNNNVNNKNTNNNTKPNANNKDICNLHNKSLINNKIKDYIIVFILFCLFGTNILDNYVINYIPIINKQYLLKILLKGFLMILFLYIIKKYI